MKRFLPLICIVQLAAILALVVVIVRQQSVASDREPRAEKMDIACGLVASALKSNANEIRKNTNIRDLILSHFGSQHLTNDPNMLHWCVPNGFNFDTFHECPDDLCRAAMMEDAARGIRRDP